MDSELGRTMGILSKSVLAIGTGSALLGTCQYIAVVQVQASGSSELLSQLSPLLVTPVSAPELGVCLLGGLIALALYHICNLQGKVLWAGTLASLVGGGLAAMLIGIVRDELEMRTCMRGITELAVLATGGALFALIYVKISEEW